MQHDSGKAFFAAGGDVGIPRGSGGGHAQVVRHGCGRRRGGPIVNVYNEYGETVRSFFAYDPNFRGGVRVSTGDVTGDGWDDVVTGTGVGGGPIVNVYDGRTGAQLFSPGFVFDPNDRSGVKVAIGNVNGSRQADIIVSGIENGQSTVKAYELLGPGYSQILNYKPQNAGVYNIAAADYDNDGLKDIVLGTPNAAVTGFDFSILSFSRGLYIGFGINAVGAVSVAGGNLDGIFGDEIGYGFSIGNASIVAVNSATNGAYNYSFANPISGWPGEVRVAFGEFRSPVYGYALRSAVISGVGSGGGPIVNVRDALNFGQQFLNTFAYDPNFRGGIYVG